MVAFYSPAQRWRELRAVAEDVQSSVFQFRKRTSMFSVKMSDPRKAEQALIDRLRASRTEVVQKAGLTDSSFARQHPGKVWKHGQNEKEADEPFDTTKLSMDGPADKEKFELDNHHSPMKPSQYISARLIPMLHYYQKRVPREFFMQKFTVILLLVSTAAIAILSSRISLLAIVIHAT